jgi:hypothetical protein
MVTMGRGVNVGLGRSAGREAALGAALGWITLVLCIVTLPVSPSGLAVVLNVLTVVGAGFVARRIGLSTWGALAAIPAGLGALVVPFLLAVTLYPDTLQGWTVAVQERALGFAVLLVLFVLGYAIGRRAPRKTESTDTALIRLGITALVLWLGGMGMLLTSAGPA